MMSVKELVTKLKCLEDWTNWIILARTTAGPIWPLCNPDLPTQLMHLTRPIFPDTIYINSGPSTPGLISNKGMTTKNIS